MFCSKCGRKIEENDKFCKGCGSKVVGEEGSKGDLLKEELKEEIKKEIKQEEFKEVIKKELREEKQKARWNGPSCLVSILLFFFVIGVITSSSGSAQSKQISTGLIIFPAII